MNAPGVAPGFGHRSDRPPPFSLYPLDIDEGHSEWPLYAVFPYPDLHLKPWERAMLDLLYLAGGVAVFLVFAGYALLLKRA